MATTNTLPSVEEREKRFEQMNPEQAQARIHTFPAQMAYEAKYALQQVREIGLDSDQLVQIVEPLAKAVGWAEALAYAFEKSTERDVVQQLVGNGIFQPGSGKPTGR